VITACVTVTDTLDSIRIGSTSDPRVAVVSVTGNKARKKTLKG
jgi:hypothetical protein